MEWILEHIGIMWYVNNPYQIKWASQIENIVYFFQFAEYNSNGEVIELKNHEIEEITNHCRKCYEEQKLSFEKRKKNSN